MDADVASYIVRFYGHLMTKEEKAAHRHLQGTLKATNGRSDVAAQEAARKGHLRDMLSDDAAVLRLTAVGLEGFIDQTANRILAEHGETILLNHCPQCGALARTPNARQCRFCGHDWHDRPAAEQIGR